MSSTVSDDNTNTLQSKLFATIKRLREAQAPQQSHQQAHQQAHQKRCMGRIKEGRGGCDLVRCISPYVTII